MEENLLGLILVVTFVKSPMPRWISRLKPLAESRLIALRPTRFLVDRMLGRKCDPRTKAWIHESMPRLDRSVLAGRVKAVLDVNVREDLKRIRAPVLYLAGSRDWLVDRKSLDTVWLSRPDVRIRVIEGTHMILQTNPRDSATDIIQFAAGVTEEL